MLERHLKYLGMPSLISHIKIDIFAPLCKSVSTVVAVWKDRLISMGGK